MKTQSIKFGGIFGIACGLWLILSYYAGFSQESSRFVFLSCLLFLFLGSFFAIFKARKISGGEIFFKDALKIGLSAGVLGAILFGIFTYIYYHYVNPEFATEILAKIEGSLKASGKSGTELQNEMNVWRKDYSATSQTGKTLLFSIFLSLFFSAINALILCKKD